MGDLALVLGGKGRHTGAAGTLTLTLSRREREEDWYRSTYGRKDAKHLFELKR